MECKQSQIFVCMLVIVILLSKISIAGAETRVFVKEYTYQASEQDSKITSRSSALKQVKRLLLEELGSYLESHTEIKDFQLTRDEIFTVTSGIVKAEVIDETWDGSRYWVKANLAADPDDVLKSIESSKNKMITKSRALIENGTEYRITFNSADIKPGPYSNDDSNPAPDSYVVVRDNRDSIIFNSGDVHSKQRKIGVLLANRNNYTPDFRGAGFNHTFSSGCVSVFIMDWDGCEGFMCKDSSKDDVIGSDFKICIGDKIGKRWIKATGWQMEVEIIPAE